MKEWNKFIKTIDFDKINNIQEQVKDKNLEEGIRVFSFMKQYSDKLVSLIPELKNYKKSYSTYPLQAQWSKDNGFRIGFYYGENYTTSTQINITIGASWGGAIFIKDKEDLIFSNKKFLKKLKHKYPKFEFDKNTKTIFAKLFSNEIAKEKNLIKYMKSLCKILKDTLKSTKTNTQNYLLLSGRTGAGKTDILIAYANLYPKTTLIYSQESSKKTLQKRGLKKGIKVVTQDTFDIDKIDKYDTLCIDYIELFNKEYITNLIKKLMQLDIRIVAVSQMKSRSYEINNVFKM